VCIRARLPIRPHSAGFKRAHLDAKGRDFLGDSVNPPTAHLAAWYRVPGTGQATTQNSELASDASDSICDTPSRANKAIARTFRPYAFATSECAISCQEGCEKQQAGYYRG
jgi:hypothetical protein